MKTISTAWYIRIVFAVIALVLALAWGANSAQAQQNEGSSLSIAPNGQIIVKNARVVSVSGNVVVAETGWGAAELSWVVQTTGSTRFTPDIGSSAALQGMERGHTISFTGVLQGSLAKPTVLASAVTDAELIHRAVSVLGTVKSIAPSDNSFVLQTESGDVLVQVYGGTLMSRDGGYMDVGDIAVGESGKAIGALNTEENSLKAERVWIKTATEEVAAEEQQESIFASIVTWLRGSRGILTVRDR